MSFFLFSFTLRYYSLFVRLRLHATLGGYIALTSCQINVSLPLSTEKVEKKDLECTRAETKDSHHSHKSYDFFFFKLMCS